MRKNMNLPTAPSPPTQPPPSQVGGIGGYVFGEADGSCLVPARVEVLDGPRAGQAVQQADCPFGDAYGYDFRDLAARPEDDDPRSSGTRSSVALLHVRGLDHLGVRKLLLHRVEELLRVADDDDRRRVAEAFLGKLFDLRGSHRLHRRDVAADLLEADPVQRQLADAAGTVRQTLLLEDSRASLPTRSKSCLVIGSGSLPVAIPEC